MTMKSIRMEMNEANVLTATIQLEGQKKMLTVCALVAYRVTDNYVSTQYTLSTSEEFTATGDDWDIRGSLEKHSPLLEAVWNMMRPVLDFNRPKPLTGNEQAEKDGAAAAPAGWDKIES